jgi:hypothetical protein
MKKLSLLLLVFAAAYQISSAQTITATGTVKNEQGNPVHYAFVQDRQLHNATYTDSLGTFSLIVNPSSQIVISGNGYSDVTLDVAGHTSFSVVLKTDPAAANGGGNSKNSDVGILQEAFKTNTATDMGPSIGINGNPVFNNVKETVGSRFLFTQWVHGYLVKANGEILQNPTLQFNYDKMKGDLFLTENLNSAMVADKNVIKSFTLFSPQDQPVTFERMTGISADLYSEVISSGSKYKIYKLITTKFIPSDYKTDGLASTGNKYDEYADDDTYYVLNLTTNNFQPLALKKKAIKEAFAAEGDKLNNFIASHGNKIDDDYLKALGDAMNK